MTDVDRTDPVSDVRVHGTRWRSQHGMTTAEYALGTVTVVTGVGALLALWAQPMIPAKVFWPIVEALIHFLLRTFGVAGG